MILGLDQGTTSTRACVMDRNGNILAQKSLRHRQFLPKPGWVEHDPEEIWSHARTLLKAVVAKAGAKGKISGLGIANQGETVMLWDRVTGKPLHRALVWQDVRAEKKMAALARDPRRAAKVQSLTGLRLDSYFSAGKIRWLLDHAPRARRLAARGRLCCGTMDAWLIWKLTRGESFVTDVSTAARTLLFDIRAERYDPWLLKIFGVPLSILPRALPSAGPFGRVRGHGLDGVPILASLVDQPAALFGHGGLKPGDLKATYGTGCFLYLNTGPRVHLSRHGLLATTAWKRDGETTYALDGGIFAAGSVVDWLRDGLGLIEHESEIDSLIKAGIKADGAAGVVCVPALAGLAAPHWKRGARAAWLGMGLSTTRAHLVYAALEGIAFRVAQVVRAMERDSGVRVKTLKADGGLAACAALMQLQADLLGVPVSAATEEATALGACFMAARASGLWKNDAPILRGRGARVFVPRIGAKERRSRVARLERAVALIKEWP